MHKATGTPDAGTPSLVPPPSANLKRRRFLLSLGAGGAGVAAASVASLPAAAALTPATPETPLSGSGYRETDHVREYYRTARI